MIGVCAAGLVGGVVGSVTTVLFTLWLSHRATRPDTDGHVLLGDADREAVAAKFAVHASAVRRQVAEYADALAGDDSRLRERLRLFEGGEGR